MVKRILFIGHDASATGAPTSLLRIINWFFENTDFKIEILLKRTGAMLNEYKEKGEVYVCKYIDYKIKPPQKLIERTIWRIHYRLQPKILDKTYLLKKELFERYKESKFNLIFCNTSTNGILLNALTFLKCPVIARIAELPFYIKTHFMNEFQYYPEKVDHFIAVSNSVKESLSECFKIDKNRISVIHGAVDIKKVPVAVDLVKELKIPLGVKIIGGSGTDLFRKGLDLFVHVAKLVVNNLKHDNIHFVWIGGERNIYFKQILNDIQIAGLTDYVHFIDHIPEPLPYFAALDIFLLTSREDPFPLVALEAAYLKKPIICFDKAGGMPEFVEDNSGFVVPYLDLYNMALRVVELASNHNQLQALGENASGKVKKLYHYNSIGEKFYNVMKNLTKEIN